MTWVIHEYGGEIGDANVHGRDVVGGCSRSDQVYRTACGSWVDDLCQVAWKSRAAAKENVDGGYATWCRRPGCSKARGADG